MCPPLSFDKPASRWPVGLRGCIAGRGTSLVALVLGAVFGLVLGR